MSRILVVDANAFVGSAIRINLARESHDTVLLQDAAAGIAALEASRFELAIIDISLSADDGLALIAKARSLAPALPIIATTGIEVRQFMELGPDLRDLAFQAGATCCLRKPFGSPQLLGAVNWCLSRPCSDDHLPVAKTQTTTRGNTTPAPETDVAESGAPVTFPLDAGEAKAEARASVAHQYRGSLTALRNYLNGIKEQSEGDPGTPEAARELIKSALHETERACVVVDLIDHSGRGRRMLNHAATRASAIIDVAAVRRGKVSPPAGREGLTPRERQVLDLITHGVSNKEGGHRLSISVRTFEAHRAHIMGKFGARNAAHLVRLAQTMREDPVSSISRYSSDAW